MGGGAPPLGREKTVTIRMLNREITVFIMDLFNTKIKTPPSHSSKIVLPNASCPTQKLNKVTLTTRPPTHAPKWLL